MKTHKHNFLLKLITVPLIIMMVIACNYSKPKIIKVNPEFARYISGYTSGMVSRKSNIRIELAYGLNEKKLADLKLTLPPNATAADSVMACSIAYNKINSALPDSSLLKDAFTFEPEIKGRAVWISDRVIEFIPAEVLPQNQFYNVEFNLSNVMPVTDELETFDFQLSTFPQNVFVQVDGLRNYDDYNIEWMKLTGKISTSDYEDSASISKVLSITKNGVPLPVQLASGYQNNEFYFYVDSLERKVKEGKILICWDGKPVNSMSTGSQEVIIPAMSDFSVTSAKVVDDGDQYVELVFSDPIQYNQNLKGIITIQGMDNLTYEVEANHVKIFLANRIEGDKLVTVTTGIKNFKGYKMNTAYSENLHFNEPNPFVRIKGNGCILPNSNGLIFPFEAISLKSVDVRVIKIFSNNVHQFLQVNSLNGDDGLTRVGKIVAEKTIALDYNKKMNLKQWNTFVIDLGKMISPEPGAIYRVSLKFQKAYTLCDCSGFSDEEGNNNGSAEERDSWNESNWHNYSFDNDYDN